MSPTRCTLSITGRLFPPECVDLPVAKPNSSIVSMMTNLDTIKQLRSVLADIHQAKGLPNRCYTDADFFQAERQAIFARNWTAIAFDSDAPGSGFACPIDFMGLPLVLVRDRAGVLRVFHNVCSHRGMKLVAKAGPIGRVLKCRYHAWCYDLAGGLRETPFIGGPKANRHRDFDPSVNGLREVPSASAFGVVFVALSADAPPFERFIAALRRRWQPFAEVELHSGGADSQFSLEVAANWKLAVENYCDSYHLPWVHPNLSRYSRLEDHEHIRDRGSGLSGQISLAYRPTLDGDDAQHFPDLSDLPEQWIGRGEYVSLYPNLLLGAHRNHFYAILILPIAPDRSQERVLISYFDAEAATGGALAKLRQANAELWRGVFVEDIWAVEGLQAGRASPAFEGGVFSPVMDGPSLDFHQWVARALLATTGDTAGP